MTVGPSFIPVQSNRCSNTAELATPRAGGPTVSLSAGIAPTGISVPSLRLIEVCLSQEAIETARRYRILVVLLLI
jgi:hypothetical protein